MRRNSTRDTRTFTRPKAKSSHSLLLDCMCFHMRAFGYECIEMNKYLGQGTFMHEDGTTLEFKTVKELIRFVREASHRKVY